MTSDPLPFVHQNVPAYYWVNGLSIPCTEVEMIALDPDVPNQVRCARCDEIVVRIREVS